MTLREALDRTLLLMRDEFRGDVGDDVLLAALTGTRVALVADEGNIASHAAQTAFVTAAMLMARSGHQVYLIAPDIPLAGPQPPLLPGLMIEQLLLVGNDMLPGISFEALPPKDEVDLAIAIGNSPFSVQARRRIRLNAEAWKGYVAPEEEQSAWKEHSWPFGAMAAAAMGAGEAFKIVMHKLRSFARNPARMDKVFAESNVVSFSLAPLDTPFCTNLGDFDCISGGAIITASLYAFARIPDVKGNARVIEHDIAGLSNLNRYMLMRRSRLGLSKADDLANILDSHGGLRVEPLEMRYELATRPSIEPLAPAVLVGVDDIPSRWEIQRSNPSWLAIGATTHWSSMVSFHQRELACAQCLHPTGTPSAALIPTVAFVSFWAGLLTAAYYLRHLVGGINPNGQQVYLTCLRPEHPMRSPVAVIANCPTCGPQQQHDVA